MMGSLPVRRNGFYPPPMADHDVLAELLDPRACALLSVECQRGVVGEGDESALPELAREARESGALAHIAMLTEAAHAAGVQVLHAVAERRPDGRGASSNARL